jgi:hypothetical protein
MMADDWLDKVAPVKRKRVSAMAKRNPVQTSTPDTAFTHLVKPLQSLLASAEPTNESLAAIHVRCTDLVRSGALLGLGNWQAGAKTVRVDGKDFQATKVSSKRGQIWILKEITIPQGERVRTSNLDARIAEAKELRKTLADINAARATLETVDAQIRLLEAKRPTARAKSA